MEKDSAADPTKEPDLPDATQPKLEQPRLAIQNEVQVTDKSDTTQSKFEKPPSAMQSEREVTGKPHRPSAQSNLATLGTIYSKDKYKDPPEQEPQQPALPIRHKSLPVTKPTKEASNSSLPQENKEQRRKSAPSRIVSKVFDTFSRKRSSSKTSDTGVAEYSSAAIPTEKQRSSLKPLYEDRRRSSNKTVKSSSGILNKHKCRIALLKIGNVICKKTLCDSPALDQKRWRGHFDKRSQMHPSNTEQHKAPPSVYPHFAMEDPRKRSSSYNPFGSFERHVSISNPGADTDKKVSTAPDSPRVSIMEKSPPGLVLLPEKTRRSSSLRPGRQRSVSVVDLTKQDVAICFFPEEPDWWDDDDDDDDDGEDDYFEPLPPKRDRSDLFPDPKTPYDWAQRERWQSRLVYLIALVTYSISFSNIYHFPSLVYHYGGIPFLIPYTIFTIILGYPLHFLESSLGQYSQSGPVRVWDAAPIARGIGWSMFLLCLIVAYYYNMYAAYSIIYFSRCFNAILPWQDCDVPATSNYSCVPRMCVRANTNHYTPAEHYFFHHVLEVRSSTEILGNGLGPMVWTQVVGFLFAWIIVYVAIIQSVRSIGKVVFVLVILPYFILLMLLTAGMMLQGSSRGLKVLFASNFNYLLDVQLWRVAAEEVFFELGICQGTPLAFGSYCHHRNPTHIDSAIICLINYCTSILCTVVIFLILGALSMEIGAPVTDVLRHGPGIVFIAYPEALSRVPGAHVWCFMFFLMLFSVAIGTQIAIMETVMTVVYDEFHNARPYRWLINLLICCCLFLLGIILCTSNGYFVVHLLDRMTGTMPRLPIAVCMVGTIVIIYGTSKYCEDVHFMIGYYPNILIRFCFLITPFMLLALTIASWVLKKPLRAVDLNYSSDAINVGWFTIWFILIWIVLGAIYWCMYCHSIGQLKYVFRSLNSWGPRNFEARVARTEFSSEDMSNFTKPWTKKSVRIEGGDAT